MTANCQAITKQGQACQAPAGAGGFCFWHDPGRGAERAQARKLGGYNRRRGHGGGDLAGVPGQVRTLPDVLGLLDYTLAETVALENGIQRGRLLVALAAGYVTAIQAGELLARVEALEMALKMRGEK